ncbi:MAG: hypothetical protein AAFU79_30000, partial [Myxococcota bacterium]
MAISRSPRLMAVVERMDRVYEVFADALEQQAEARLDFVRRACGDDALLAGRVLDMLEAHAAAPPEFLGAPPLSTTAIWGQYELSEIIGQGAMGQVYRG